MNFDLYYGGEYIEADGTMTFTASVLADMDANDTAYIQVAASVTITNSGNLEHAYYSGHLLG